MKKIILLLMFSTSFIGCSTTSTGINELEKRANYNLDPKNLTPEKQNFSRKNQRVERVCIGGRFLKSGDRFLGGWVDLVIEDAEWIFNDPILKKIRKKK